MNSKFLLTACLAAVVGPISLSRVPVAAQSPYCQSAYVFQTDNLDNDFGNCRPELSVKFNQLNSASPTEFAHKADNQVAIAVSQYNEDIAARSERQIAQNKLQETKVAISNLKIECPTTKGAVKYLCQPAKQQISLQKTGSSRIAYR